MSHNTNMTSNQALTGAGAAMLVARQSLVLVADGLESLQRVGVLMDDGPDGVDTHIGLTIDLLADEVACMRSDPHDDLEAFVTRWYRMSSAAHLAARCYGGPVDAYGRALAQLVTWLDVLPDLWGAVDAAGPDGDSGDGA